MWFYNHYERSKRQYTKFTRKWSARSAFYQLNHVEVKQHVTEVSGHESGHPSYLGCLQDATTYLWNALSPNDKEEYVITASEDGDLKVGLDDGHSTLIGGPNFFEFCPDYENAVLWQEWIQFGIKCFSSSFSTGMKKQVIPWGALVKDPYSWISEECLPPGFEWKDPSKIQIGEIFRLLDHWRDRQDLFLDPLMWMSSCPLLLDALRPSKRTHNVGRSTTQQRQVSDEETFQLPLSEECEEGKDDSSEIESKHGSNNA
ncbi:hypothetical protein EI94DRAFT_1702661 [Lactarius quietus]|nr:hypothetical protein EI94DRAFT_1702661 [Lactarius quietus]